MFVHIFRWDGCEVVQNYYSFSEKGNIFRTVDDTKKIFGHKKFLALGCPKMNNGNSKCW